MSCLQAWLPQRTRSPTTKTPRTAAVRTIHSSTFSTENSLRPDLFTSLDVAGAQCDSRIVGSLWTPLLVRSRLWRSLPLFPVKKFNGQETDDRTLKVEIAKSGGAGGKDGGHRSSGGRSDRY